MRSLQKNNSAKKLLEVDNLLISALYPSKKVLVRNLKFDIGESETVALVGESGSGKSVTALSLFGLQPNGIRIFDGTIKFRTKTIFPKNGADLRLLRRFSVGFVFQDAQSSLNPVITVGKQILEVLKSSGMSNESFSKQKHKVIGLLEEVEIDEPLRIYKSFPHQLSGGMKQRVMIAIALAKNPKLLIADEPTTALDVSVQAKILNLIKQIQKKTGMSILFITHDLAVAFEIADRIMVMKGGEIVDQSLLNPTCLDNPSEYSKSLINSLPSWSKRTKDRHAFLKNMSESVVRVKNLNISFKLKKDNIFSRRKYFKAVDDVTFAVRKGSTLAVVGESGSGKTTLAKTILGLCPAEISGQVLYKGTNILECNQRTLKKIRANLQVVFQDPLSSLNPRMRIGDIIREGIIIHQPKNNNSETINLKISQLLADVGLSDDIIHRFPHEFSGGQRQRVCIARALAVEPEVIVCDEPTSSLDVLIQAQIIDLLKELQSTKHISYLFITHDINLVSYFADDVLVLRKGRVVEHGSVKDIIMNTSNPYTQSLLAAAPKIPSDLLKRFK